MKKYRRGVVRKRSVKKKYLKSLQNSQESTCAGVFFNRITDPKPVNLLINDSSAGVFIWILRNKYNYFAKRFWAAAFENNFYLKSIE